MRIPVLMGIDQISQPAAFRNPPVATTIGQTDYSPLGGQDTQVHGPGYDNLDFSLFQAIPHLREHAFGISAASSSIS